MVSFEEVYSWLDEFEKENLKGDPFVRECRDVVAHLEARFGRHIASLDQLDDERRVNSFIYKFISSRFSDVEVRPIKKSSFMASMVSTFSDYDYLHFFVQEVLDSLFVLTDAKEQYIKVQLRFIEQSGQRSGAEEIFKIIKHQDVLENALNKSLHVDFQIIPKLFVEFAQLDEFTGLLQLHFVACASNKKSTDNLKHIARILNANGLYSDEVMKRIKSARFPNLDDLFSTSKLLFERQDYLFDIFDKYNFMLIGGGTGIGKTAVVPILLYYFIKSKDNGKPAFVVSEPRITATKNPFNFMLKNIGQHESEETKKIETKYFSNKDALLEYFYSSVKRAPSDKAEDEEGKAADDEASGATEYEVSETGEVKLKSFRYLMSLYKSLGLRYRGSDKTLNRCFANRCSIQFVTDGILYNSIRSNPGFLYSIDVLIVDEVHENSLNIIFSLFYIHHILIEDEKLPPSQRRLKNLRVLLITAACQPAEKQIYRQLLRGLYDVSKLPSVTNFKVTKVAESKDNVVQIVSANANKNGLVFFPTKNEISKTYDKLVGLSTRLIVLKLTTEVNKREYKEKFEDLIDLVTSNKFNYLILATNIAESSVTFKGLDYVIDTGRQNSKFYNHATKVSSLSVEPMTLNSQVQRLGRVGRKSDGTYYYLYDPAGLIEYKNKLRIENIYENILDIVSFNEQFASVNLVDSLVKIFSLESVMPIYINDLEQKLQYIRYERPRYALSDVFTQIASFRRKAKGLNQVPLTNFCFLYHYPTLAACYLVMLVKHKMLEVVFDLDFSIVNPHSDIENAVVCVNNYFSKISAHNTSLTEPKSMYETYLQLSNYEDLFLSQVSFRVENNKNIKFNFKKPIKTNLLVNVKREATELYDKTVKHFKKVFNLNEAVFRSFYFCRTNRLDEKSTLKNYKIAMYFESDQRAALGMKIA